MSNATAGETWLNHVIDPITALSCHLCLKNNTMQVGSNRDQMFAQAVWVALLKCHVIHRLAKKKKKKKKKKKNKW